MENSPLICSEKQLIVCVRIGQMCNQRPSNIHVGNFDKIVSNINSKMLTILAKGLILVTGLGPGRASVDGYITVLII